MKKMKKGETRRNKEKEGETRRESSFFTPC